MVFKYDKYIWKILNKYGGKNSDHMLWLKLCQYFKEDNPMSDDKIKEQLDKLKAEQKAKSNKRKFVENYIKKNANRFEDKLTAVKITQKADQNLFANAIKELMKKN